MVFTSFFPINFGKLVGRQHLGAADAGVKCAVHKEQREKKRIHQVNLAVEKISRYLLSGLDKFHNHNHMSAVSQYNVY